MLEEKWKHLTKQQIEKLKRETKSWASLTDLPNQGHQRDLPEAITVELTEEQTKAIQRTLGRYASIANAQALDGMETFVPKKVKDSAIARGLTEYAEDLLLRHRSDAEDISLSMEKAIKAMMKAYAVHNLPVYLFRVAAMFEFFGDTANAKPFFQQFLQAQSNFTPDDVDNILLKHIGFDSNAAVAAAVERASAVTQNRPMRIS